MSRPGSNDDDNRSTGYGDTASGFAGSASDVVQARDVHGGVHFHGPSTPSPAVPPRQLPGDVRGFVNRQAELAYLDRVLVGDPDEPLVVGVTVIAGTAGVGKTSLALHWAHRVHDRFPDGQLYINLRGYDPGPPVTAEQALDQFLRTLGVRPDAIPTDLGARAALFRSLMAGRRVLVVLDNAVKEGQVRPLLPGTAGSLALVTSRSRLGGLAAREGAHRLTLEVLSEEEAVHLIRVVTSEQRQADNMAEVAELARLCARLPLALRIAAERAVGRPRMDLGELIDDLRDESGLWDILSTGADEDSDAVRTVFAWSYRALTPDVARAFRLLGLHPGPDFSAEAAAALTEMPRSRFRRCADVLIGAHLLQDISSSRYQFHDLLRAFAADQARTEETSDVYARTIRRCVGWYLQSASAAQQALDPTRRGTATDSEPDLTPMSFADRDGAMSWLHVERANIVAAMRTAAAHGMDDLASRFPPILLSFYGEVNAFEDWFATGRIGLESARRIGDRHAEAENLENLGIAFCQYGRLDEGAEYHSEALAIRRELGDRYGEALALNRLSLVHLRRRKFDEASDGFRSSRDLFRELGEVFWTAQVTANLADAEIELGHLVEAESLIRQAIPVFREHGEEGSEGDALVSLSRIARERGRTHDALPRASESVNIADRLASPVDRAFWLLELAAVHRALGHPDEALVACHESAVLHRQLGDRTREALAWDATGEAYQDLDRPDDAIPFHRMAATVHHDLGDAWNEANALAHLAQALAVSGEPEAAAIHWQSAVALLAAYDDPRSRQLRDELTATDN